MKEFFILNHGPIWHILGVIAILKWSEQSTAWRCIWPSNLTNRFFSESFWCWVQICYNPEVPLWLGRGSGNQLPTFDDESKSAKSFRAKSMLVTEARVKCKWYAEPQQSAMYLLDKPKPDFSNHQLAFWLNHVCRVRKSHWYYCTIVAVVGVGLG